MSLRKKDVYSTLSDYSRKVLGKSCSLEQAILNDKSCSLEQAILSDKSCSEQETILIGRDKNKINPTPTPPNSPNYKHINTDISIKTIEEPYSIQEAGTNELIDIPKPERTSFQICRIM